MGMEKIKYVVYTYGCMATHDITCTYVNWFAKPHIFEDSSFLHHGVLGASVVLKSQ